MSPRPVRALVAAAHPGPTLAVTTLTALLAGATGRPLGVGVLVTAAVLAGQLSIGWSNDLIDATRDARIGRSDKPVASGAVSERLVRQAITISLLACVALSLACGWRSGVTHLALVGAGWAYNLGLKSSLWSAVPYAVAFGALPAVVTLAGPDPRLPVPSLFVTGALLGVGAHLLNALPDLADDAATGVRGLPHRLGDRGSRVLGAAALAAALSLAAGWRSDGFGGASGFLGDLGLVMALGLAGVLGLVVVLGRGRWPFAAAIAAALVAVVALLLRAG